MNRRLLILAIVCEMASWGWAANVNLDFYYSGWDRGIDAEGNLYVLIRDFDPNTNWDFLTVKYSKEGKKLWESRFDGPIHGRDTISAITLDVPGNVYVTGRVQIADDVNVGKKFGCATIKYDKDGKQLWAALYENSSEEFLRLNSIAVDINGNAYLTGSDTIKYSRDGRQLWVISSDGAAIKPDLFGNVYVVGGRPGEGTFTTRKYNSNGKLLWNATYSGQKPTFSVAKALAVDNTGAVSVFGYSWHFDDKYGQFVTVKYDSKGRQQWVVQYREASKKKIYPVGIVLDDAGNVYITGCVSTPGRQEHGYGDNPLPLMMEFVTIKYDARGKEQWAAKYKGTKHRRGSVNGLGIDGAGNVYVKGYVEHPQLRNKNVGIIIKYNDNGSQKWVTHFEDISESAKNLLPSYSPPPDKVGAKWFESLRAAKKAALLSDIRKSSDLNAKDARGYTLLGRAASEGYIDIVKMLIGKGARVTDGALCAGIRAGQADIVKILAQAHGDITADSPCVFEALTYLDEPAVVKALLEGGLDAGSKDRNGDSLLSWPFDYGHYEIVKMLLDAGADVNARDLFGEPLVHEAIGASDLDVFKAFINAGVRLDTKNTYGQTLLEAAVEGNNTAVVRLLLDEGVDVAGEKRDGALLLFEAVDHDNVDIVRLLIEAGVDPSVRDENGCTALYLAAAYPSKNVLYFLLDLGLDVNAKNTDGRTPLQQAIECNGKEIAEILRKYGAKE